MRWDVKDATAIIKYLQPKAWASGYALCLGGGVLNNGYSDNDLDIVAMPGSHDTQDLDKLLASFSDCGYYLENTVLKHPGIVVYKLYGKIDLVIPFLDKSLYAN